MAVKIVTDSSADIPPQLLKDWTYMSFPYVSSATMFIGLKWILMMMSSIKAG
jgi:hypothetical protein